MSLTTTVLFKEKERKKANGAVHHSAVPTGLTIQPDANCL